MLSHPLTPLEMQIGQIVGGIAVAVFVGIRFVPARYRQTAGIALTGAYLLFIAAFLIYVVLR